MKSSGKLAQIAAPTSVGDNFGESLVGSQAPPSFWEVPGLPRKFPELPRKFSATSPEVLSLWNLTAIRRFPGSFPNFPTEVPQTSPEVPGLPRRSALSLGSLTPSPDSQKLSLTQRTHLVLFLTVPRGLLVVVSKRWPELKVTDLR